MTTSMHGTRHVPVMLGPVVEALAPEPRTSHVRCWIDGTIGGGGHAAALLDRTSPDGRLIGLDRDPAAIARSAERLAGYGERCTLVHGSFAQLAHHAHEHGAASVAGILLDLGFSSDQIEDGDRGLSFQLDGPLDMRLDPTQGPTAAELIDELDVDALADVIWRFGDERHSRRIARAIGAARPVLTTHALAAVVAGAVPRQPGRRAKRHPATKTFQALRIAVNEELEALHDALPQTVDRLAPGGRLVVISFHSLEDRIVKRFVRDEASGCRCPEELPICVCDPQPRLRLVHRKALVADAAELAANPRARSAKVRVAERLPDVVAGRVA